MQQAMRKAIVHIGTEKTGTTSIQSGLFINRDELARRGWLFPISAGLQSNFRLVMFCKDTPPPFMLNFARLASADDVDEKWRREFADRHRAEVQQFQRQRNESVVVYSSEHLQSTLVEPEEVERLADFLSSLYDEVEIVVYLRRQDRFALSAHNTALRAGLTKPFDFSRIHPNSPYYNFLGLLERWSCVFGDRCMRVRVFERDKLVGGDAVRDFFELVGLDSAALGLTIPAVENEALSWTAQQLLYTFNRLVERLPNTERRQNSSMADGNSNGVSDVALARALRGKRRDFVRHVETIRDDYGKVLPPRAEAEAFQAQFDAANAELFERWLPGQSFDRRFTEYRTEPGLPPPLVDAKEQVRAWLETFSVAA